MRKCEEGFEIYLEDLKKDVQEELLNFLGVESEYDLNADIIPLFIFPKPDLEK